MKTTPKKQTSKDQFWADENGDRIPFNRTTKLERLQETVSHRLLNEAGKVQAQIIKLKDHAEEQTAKVLEQFLAEKGITLEQWKGKSRTFTNFNGTIKVEVESRDRIDFDPMSIEAAKTKLMDFLEQNIATKDQFIHDMVMGAFQTTRGKLDPKRIMGLTKYRSRIKDAQFQEAINLIEASIKRTKSKTYFRIWEKDEANEWQNVDLNFSSL